jgi:hypothetical protein
VSPPRAACELQTAAPQLPPSSCGWMVPASYTPWHAMAPGCQPTSSLRACGVGLADLSMLTSASMGNMTSHPGLAGCGRLRSARRRSVHTQSSRRVDAHTREVRRVQCGAGLLPTAHFQCGRAGAAPLRRHLHPPAPGGGCRGRRGVARRRRAPPQPLVAHYGVRRPGTCPALILTLALALTHLCSLGGSRCAALIIHCKRLAAVQRGMLEWDGSE